MYVHSPEYIFSVHVATVLCSRVQDNCSWTPPSLHYFFWKSKNSSFSSHVMLITYCISKRPAYAYILPMYPTHPILHPILVTPTHPLPMQMRFTSPDSASNMGSRRPPMVSEMKIERVLISDPIDPLCVELLVAAGMKVDCREKIPLKELIEIIPVSIRKMKM